MIIYVFFFSTIHIRLRSILREITSGVSFNESFFIRDVRKKFSKSHKSIYIFFVKALLLKIYNFEKRF